VPACIGWTTVPYSCLHWAGRRGYMGGRSSNLLVVVFSHGFGVAVTGLQSASATFTADWSVDTGLESCVQNKIKISSKFYTLPNGAAPAAGLNTTRTYNATHVPAPPRPSHTPTEAALASVHLPGPVRLASVATCGSRVRLVCGWVGFRGLFCPLI
jgi:hypothetical protein